MTTFCSGPMQLDWNCVYGGDANLELFQLSRDNVPWDLTGATLRAQARVAVSDTGAPALTATIQPVTPATGTFLVGWDGVDVRDLLVAAGVTTMTLVWDLEVSVIGVPLVETVVGGKLGLVLDVTR